MPSGSLAVCRVSLNFGEASLRGSGVSRAVSSVSPEGSAPLARQLTASQGGPAPHSGWPCAGKRTHVHVHAHVHTHAYTCAHTHTHASTCAHIRMQAYTCTHTHTHTNTNTTMSKKSVTITWQRKSRMLPLPQAHGQVTCLPQGLGSGFGQPGGRCSFPADLAIDELPGDLTSARHRSSSHGPARERLCPAGH